MVECGVRLKETLAAVAEAPLWSLTVEEHQAALVNLAGIEVQLAALRMRVLASADRNQVGRDQAASSTAAWLAHATRQVVAGAHAHVRFARALDGDFTKTRQALAQCRVNLEQARVIVKAVADLPDRVCAFDRRRAEAHLLELAADFDAKALKVFGRKIFEVIDPAAAEKYEGEKLEKEEREAARKRSLRFFDNGDGTVSGKFKIPALHAQMLKKALFGLVSPRRVGKDGRCEDGTPLDQPDLLGRGLCEFIERYPVNRLPKAGGINATIVVTMTLEQLLGGLGVAGLDTGGHISAGEARRLACEAGIVPAVLGSKSVILDLGRKTRFHTEAQRIAIGLRDKTCRAEGCDRPRACATPTTPGPGPAAGGPRCTTGCCCAPGTTAAPTTPPTT